jgi:hypothetical protein
MATRLCPFKFGQATNRLGWGRVEQTSTLAERSKTAILSTELLLVHTTEFISLLVARHRGIGSFRPKGHLGRSVSAS